MSEGKKFTLSEVRAAKARNVIRTAVRPPPPPPRPRRSFVKPVAIALTLLTTGLLLYWVVTRLGHQSALKRLRLASWEQPSLAGAPALASDRELEALLSAFRFPGETHWPELEATANLKETGNARARELAAANQEFLERFRRVFASDTASMADVLKSGKTLLDLPHDGVKLHRMLLGCVAMGHYLLESGESDAGEATLLGVLRAGQLVERGTGGLYHVQAYATGQTAAGLARRQLLRHGYAGRIPPLRVARLASRLQAAAALEADYRRLLMAERDWVESVLERIRDDMGLWWPLMLTAGHTEPAPALRAMFDDCLETLEQRPQEAAERLTGAFRSLPSLARDAASSLVHAPAYYPRELANRSLAAGSVAAALAIIELSRKKEVPGRMEDLSTPLPKDPVTGRDFVYQKLGDGFRLYAIGPDGRDDGGDEKLDVLILGPGKQ
jgi:hypothetical protein